MKYALTNCSLIDGSENMKVQSNKTILIENSKIVKISDGDIPTEGYEIIDMKGQYVMPGLINLHVHIPATGRPKKKQTDAKTLVKILKSSPVITKGAYEMFKSLVKTEVMSGVTTMRTVGGVLDFDTRYRDEINEGKLTGPRIIAANMAISVPRGHMAGSVAYEAKSVDDVKKYIKDITSNDVDLLKLMITGGVLDAEKRGEPGVLRMPAEFVKTACDEAHKLGLKVAAHVESTEGVRVALENGVDSIEHGAKLDDELIKLFKEKGAVDVCTISPAVPYVFFDRRVSYCNEEQQFNGNVVFSGIVDCAKACLENGIPVGLGTDTGCPFITHYNMWREVGYFHHFCKVSNAFALHTATAGNAKILGLENETGSLKEGYSADIIGMKENPLDDIGALRNLSFVMARGQIIDNTKLKKYDKVERELDKTGF